MHPPINREETVVRVFIRNVWKVAFEQWIERLQHKIFVGRRAATCFGA